MSLQQNRRADRVDRAVLTVAGGLIAAAGVGALLAGAGAFGQRASDATIFGPGIQQLLDDHGALVALGAAVVLLVIGALAVGWLLFLLRPVPQAPSLRLVSADAPSAESGADPFQVAGRVTLDPKALVTAVERELDGLPGVAGSTVRIPDRRPVEVHALVSLHDGIDTTSVLRAVEQQVRPRIMEATGLQELRILLELKPIAEAPRRVA